MAPPTGGPRARDRIGPVPLALAAAWALCAARSRPPPARPAGAPQTEFSAERAASALERLLGDERPRPSGSPAHADLLAALRAELSGLGLEVELEETLVQRGAHLARVQNLLARLPGQNPGKAVLLVAHTDSVAAGPGAGDDGSGVATLLETARALRAGEAPERDVLFLFSDGEEDGLCGARAFVEQHPWRERVGVALNFEARGTGGPSMLFQTSGPNRWLVAAAAEALERPWTSSVADLVYRRMPNDTDLSVFLEAGIPGLNFAFIDGLARYHTPRDDLEHLDRRSLQHHGDAALALARAFARRDLDAPRAGGPPGDAVFFDVLATGIAAWPSRASLPLAALSAGLALAGATRMLRSLRSAGRRTAWVGGLALLAALVAALVAGTAGPFAAGVVTGRPFPALAHPWTLDLAAAAGVLAAVCACAQRGRAPAAAGGALAALALGFAALGLAAAALAPAASYPFLIPAGLAGLGMFCAPRRAPWVEALAGFAAAVLWLPLTLGLRLSFGFHEPALIAASLSATGLWLTPSVLRAGRAAVRPFGAALVALALLGILLGATLPSETRSAPGWLSLSYSQTPDGSASVAAETHGRRLPPELEDALGFVRSAEGLYVATVPSANLTGPRAELVEELGLVDGRRRARVRLSSPRGAPSAWIELAPGVELCRVALPATPEPRGGQGLEPSMAGGTPAGRTWWFSGLSPEGLEVDLAAGPGGRIGLELFDQAAGLPGSLAELASSRPPELVPHGQGDATVVGAAIDL
jgi:hypothetical protein